MKRIILVLLIVLVSGIVFGGAALYLFPYNPVEPPQVDTSGSSIEGINQVVVANNKFSLDLYSKLIEKEYNQENLFFSPYSIFTAFAMAYNGADGNTAKQIKDVFYFPEDNVLKSNSAAIYTNLNKKDKEYELRTGNALWTQKDYKFLDEYKNNIEKYFGGKAADLDFINDTENSRLTINGFIEDQTNNKIKEIIPSGVLSSMTRLVITNAIYFKGDWEYEFDKQETRVLDFKINPTRTSKVPTMVMAPKEKDFNYLDNEDLQILELPYKDNEVSMLILLPKNDLVSLESNLTLEKLDSWKNEMKGTSLTNIHIPKFELDIKYTNIAKDFQEMGIIDAFTPYADFSKMNGLQDLYISNVIHQAYIKVDEKGTEAAATSIGINGEGIADELTFIADHPFIFIIQEKQTGQILFMGRIINPISNPEAKGGPIKHGECGDNVCDLGENTSSYPYYCPDDCK